jgi:hypothetical protein
MSYIAPISEAERFRLEKEKAEQAEVKTEAEVAPVEAPAEEAKTENNIAEKLTGFFSNILKK